MRILFNLAIASFMLFPHCAGAAEASIHWAELTPIQHEALQPLEPQWDTLPAKLQKHLLRASNDYPKLRPEKKKLFHNRLVQWSKLTPEQRERARNNFLAYRKAPPEERARLKRKAETQVGSDVAANQGTRTPR